MPGNSATIKHTGMDARLSSASSGMQLARALVCALLVSQSGCINMGTMLGKTLFGDPYQPSLFRQQTRVNLETAEAEVALVCTTNMEVSRNFDALHLDLQDELSRQLRRREIPVSDINAINDALGSNGGDFDPYRISQAVSDARFLFHIAVERVSINVPDSVNLRQGRANGTIRGYEVRTDTATGAKRIVQVFEHPIQVEYPDHPVQVEHLSEKLFLQQFIDKVTAQVGQVFYDVDIYDLNRD